MEESICHFAYRYDAMIYKIWVLFVLYHYSFYKLNFGSLSPSLHLSFSFSFPPSSPTVIFLFMLSGVSSFQPEKSSHISLYNVDMLPTCIYNLGDDKVFI